MKSAFAKKKSVRARMTALLIGVCQVAILTGAIGATTVALNKADHAQKLGFPFSDQLTDIKFVEIAVYQSSLTLLQSRNPWNQVGLRVAVDAGNKELRQRLKTLVHGGPITTLKFDQESENPFISVATTRKYDGALKDPEAREWLDGRQGNIEKDLLEFADRVDQLLKGTNDEPPVGQTLDTLGLAVPNELRTRIESQLDAASQKMRAVEEARVATARRTASGIVVMAVIVIFVTVVSRSRRQALKRAEQRRNWAERRFATLLGSTSELVVVVDRRGNIAQIGSASARFVGRTPEQLTGTSVFDLYDHGDEDSLTRWFRRLTETRDGISGSAFSGTLRGPSGEMVAVEMSGSDMSSDPVIGGVILSIRDVSRERRLEQQAEFLTARDPLTGSPRRPVLFEQLEALDLLEALPAMGPDGKMRARTTALILVRVPTLKLLEQNASSIARDQLLSAVAGRVRMCAEPGDVLARTDIDEFAIIATGAESEESVMDRAKKIVSTVNGPMLLEGISRNVTCRIGISFRKYGVPATELLTWAAKALEHAAANQILIQVYSQELPAPQQSPLRRTLNTSTITEPGAYVRSDGTANVSPNAGM